MSSFQLDDRRFKHGYGCKPTNTLLPWSPGGPHNDFAADQPCVSNAAIPTVAATTNSKSSPQELKSSSAMQHDGRLLKHEAIAAHRQIPRVDLWSCIRHCGRRALYCAGRSLSFLLASTRQAGKQFQVRVADFLGGMFTRSLARLL